MANDTPRADGASSEPSVDAADDTTVDAATDATDADVASSPDERDAETTTRDDRYVEVPTHVYKRVTVFSTLFAVVTVVAGFLLLDSATRRATLELSEVDPLLALAGLGCIVLGAVTYAFSTRFQAEGMGNAKEESDESSNNG